MEIGEIRVDKNIYTRTNRDDYYGVYYVEVGEKYKRVSFSIKELDRSFYWRDVLYVPAEWNEEQINKVVNDYVKTLTKEDVEQWQRSLDEILSYPLD